METPTSISSADALDALLKVRAEIGKAVVGQDAALTGLVIGLLCRGHILLEGVPGVAKTLMIRALSQALSLDNRRVQFTPDLMPADITGQLIFDMKSSTMDYRPGPVFTNVLLADEINRTPPKTQAALLEAMEERQVTVDGVSRPLPDPFFVAATQNPIEFDGTYPLPEAQMDRFLLTVSMPLPERDTEIEVLSRHLNGFNPRDLKGAGITAVATAEELAAAANYAAATTVSPDILGYIVDLVRATRETPSLSLGVSPRGATALLATSRAWAWLTGRSYVNPDDVKSLARATLRHRLQLSPEAESDGVTLDAVLDNILATVEVPR